MVEREWYVLDALCQMPTIAAVEWTFGSRSETAAHC